MILPIRRTSHQPFPTKDAPKKIHGDLENVRKYYVAFDLRKTFGNNANFVINYAISLKLFK